MSYEDTAESGIVPAALSNAHVIVLAGGNGARVAEISRRLHGTPVPKQFCRFGARTTLLQATIERLEGVVSTSRMNVVATGRHHRLAALQVRRYAGVRVLGQPLDRGTGVGLLLGILEVMSIDPNAFIIVSPADHTYANAQALRSAIRVGSLAVARSDSDIAVIGAEPAGRRANYGWLVLGERDALTNISRARWSREAPMGDARALANTFVLMGRARAFVDLYMAQAPAWLEALSSFMVMPSWRRRLFLERTYAGLRPLGLMQDVLAGSQQLVTYPLPDDAGWSDLGDAEGLFDWMHDNGGAQLLPVAKGWAAPRDLFEGKLARQAALWRW